MKKKIVEIVSNTLGELSSTTVKVANDKTINILANLASTPRSGKSTRIDRYQLNLPKRSLLDHITSLSYQAEVYLEISNFEADARALAYIISFHDIAEAIMGDVPAFTSQELAKELYKTRSEKDSAEEVANTLIASAMKGGLKTKFLSTIELLNNKEDELIKFFHMVDKTDPIIGIWR